MEFIGLLRDNIGAVALGLLSLGAVVCFSYSGWLHQTAFGDPQQMARARSAFFGGVIGLLIGGFAFAIPEIISGEIIGPSGGDPVVVTASAECDDMLRNRLAVGVQANTGERMGQVVRFIQAQNPRDCGVDLWDPFIGHDIQMTSGVWYAHYRIGCFGSRGGTTAPLSALSYYPYTVGGVQVPGSFIYDPSSTLSQKPRPVSSRDGSNNVLVYFGHATDYLGNLKGGNVEIYHDRVSSHEGRPTDGAACWLFLARENLWVSQ